MKYINVHIFNLFIHLYAIYTFDFLGVRNCVIYKPYNKPKNDLAYTKILSHYALNMLEEFPNSVKNLFKIFYE